MLTVKVVLNKFKHLSIHPRAIPQSVKTAVAVPITLALMWLIGAVSSHAVSVPLWMVPFVPLIGFAGGYIVHLIAHLFDPKDFPNPTPPTPK